MNEKTMNIINCILYYVIAPALFLEFVLSDFGIIAFTTVLYITSIIVVLIFVGVAFFYKKQNPKYDFKPNDMYTKIMFLLVLMECFHFSGFFNQKGEHFVIMKANMAVRLRFFLICMVLCFVSIASIAYMSFLRDKENTDQINLMQQQIDNLETALTELESKDRAEKVKYSDGGYNYLAIGNSITKHNITEYWWNENGMAASTREKDYYHRVCSYLKNKYNTINSYAVNYFIWEVQAADRGETYDLIDGYLDAKLDLVTIQLSENVKELNTYQDDYEALIRYIHARAPKAQIIVIDDFWGRGERATLKKKAAEATGVQFADLNEIKGKDEYRCLVGTTVYGAQGEAHVVEHEGVAIHPGDKGMEYIANAVIAQIQ